MTSRRNAESAERTERRRNVRLLHQSGITNREIARRLGIGVGTVYRDLEALELIPPRPANAPPAPRGNTRAMTHGATSERMLAPVRETRAAELRETYPWMDSGRIATQAQRLAQIELGAEWLDGKGSVVKDDEGKPWPIADLVAKWIASAEKWFERAEQERRDRGRGPSPIAAMQGHVINEGEQP